MSVRRLGWVEAGQSRLASSSRVGSRLQASSKDTTCGCSGRYSQPTIHSNMSQVAEAAMAASYKSLKEDFVSNLTGGDIGEINYVTAVAPVRSNTLLTNSPDLRIGSSNRLVSIAITTFIF